MQEAAAVSQMPVDLSAVRQLSASAITRLLQEFYDNWTINCAERLFQLPAARLLSTSELRQLLDTCIVLKDGPYVARQVQQICRLPAAQGLDRSVVEQLLLTAEEEGSVACKLALLQLSTAAAQNGS
jgi:hypothetical protein